MKKIKGFQSAIEALRGLDGKSQDRILREILKKDPEMAERLKKNIFQFEDILKINPNGILALCREIPEPQLVLALRGEKPEFVSSLLKHFVQRKSEMIRVALQQLGPQPLHKIQQAQKEILDKALAMAEKGQLVFAKDDDPLV